MVRRIANLILRITNIIIQPTLLHALLYSVSLYLNVILTRLYTSIFPFDSLLTQYDNHHIFAPDYLYKVEDITLYNLPDN